MAAIRKCASGIIRVDNTGDIPETAETPRGEQTVADPVQPGERRVSQDSERVRDSRAKDIFASAMQIRSAATGRSRRRSQMMWRGSLSGRRSCATTGKAAHGMAVKYGQQWVHVHVVDLRIP